MSISKTRSLVLPVLFLVIGSGVACSEGADPGYETGGGTATGGAAAGGAPGSGGAIVGGASTSGGAAAGGAASGGASSGGASSGGAAAGGAAAGGADGAGGGSDTGGGSGTGGDGSGGGGSTVEFSEVAALMVMRCGTCHVAPGSMTKPNFSNADAIAASFDSTPPIAQCGNHPLVTPGDTSMSAIAMLINGACTAGGPGAPAQMPPTGKIADAEIQLIEDWITGGAPMPE